MNHLDHLREWAAEWAMHQALTSTSVAEPQTPPTLDPSASVSLTVSSKFSPSAMMLRQLEAAIVPDDARRALDAGLKLVSASDKAAAVSLARGEIRQLNPDLKPAWLRPVIVLLLSVDAERQRVLAVPFGPLAKPAFQSELSSGIADESLAVLCVWNAVWLPMDLAARSWVVDHAADSLLTDIETLRSALANKQTPPESLITRIGPPLLHPTDPRQAYVTHEESLLEDLTAGY
jgi:hypothetical protein